MSAKRVYCLMVGICPSCCIARTVCPQFCCALLGCVYISSRWIHVSLNGHVTNYDCSSAIEITWAGGH